MYCPKCKDYQNRCGSNFFETKGYCKDCGTKLVSITCKWCNEWLASVPEWFLDKYCKGCGRERHEALTSFPSSPPSRLEQFFSKFRKGIKKGTYCPSCEKDRKSNLFCYECGKKLVATKCNWCKHGLREKDHHCEGCGRTREEALKSMPPIK